LSEKEFYFLLMQAKKGDKKCRNQLIEKYRPFILKAAAQVSGRFINMGEDDEASIALIAFNEAIDSFDESKGCSFIGFAQTVIRRRLIDFYRSEKKRVSIPFSQIDDGPGNVLGSAEFVAAAAQYDADVEKIERREEIERFTQTLSSFDIKFDDLVKASPKHETARQRAMEVAVAIARNEHMRKHLYSYKSLPLKELSTRAKVSRKTLERQRKYIIAAVIILTSDFYYLKEYIKKVL